MFLIPTVLLPSPIHGIGVFTRVPIARGTKIWEFTPGFDQVYTESDLVTLTDVQRASFLFYCYRDPKYGGKFVLCGDNARHFNFSANPNTAEGDPDEPSTTYAIRDIAAGEELTYSPGEDLDAERKLAQAGHV